MHVLFLDRIAWLLTKQETPHNTAEQIELNTMKQSRARRPRPSWSTEPVISISLDKLIADSRASGTLNLANKQLHEVGRGRQTQFSSDRTNSVGG